MSKYDEIMDRIVVTPEMKKRILSNIDKSDLKTNSKIILLHSYRKFLSIAACFAVLLIGTVTVTKLLNTGTPEEFVDFAGIVEVDTVEELSQAVGFDIEDLTSLPFEATETIYTDYGDGLAEIAYISENQTLYYRKSFGKDDNSGDYNIYDLELEVAVQDISVTLKGNNDLFMLAIWTDGQYSYSISLTDGISKEGIINLVSEINKK